MRENVPFLEINQNLSRKALTWWCQTDKRGKRWTVNGVECVCFQLPINKPNGKMCNKNAGISVEKVTSYRRDDSNWRRKRKALSWRDVCLDILLFHSSVRLRVALCFCSFCLVRCVQLTDLWLVDYCLCCLIIGKCVTPKHDRPIIDQFSTYCWSPIKEYFSWKKFLLYFEIFFDSTQPTKDGKVTKYFQSKKETLSLNE